MVGGCHNMSNCIKVCSIRLEGWEPLHKKIKLVLSLKKQLSIKVSWVRPTNLYFNMIISQRITAQITGLLNV